MEPKFWNRVFSLESGTSSNESASNYHRLVKSYCVFAPPVMHLLLETVVIWLSRRERYWDDL